MQKQINFCYLSIYFIQYFDIFVALANDKWLLLKLPST